MNRSSERGSALLMLFVAVALFGALAFAFTQGSRTSTGMISDSALKANISDLFSYAGSIQSAITRLKLRGCTNGQINLKSPSGDYNNTTSPTDGTCDVFSAAGGGIQWKTPNAALLDTSKSFYTSNGYGAYFFSNRVRVMGMGTDCAADTCTELLLELPHLTKKACEQINAALGLTPNPTINSTITSHNFGNTIKFTGTYGFVSTGNTSTIGDDETWLIGKRSGCTYQVGADLAGYPYTFYHVLLAR